MTKRFPELRQLRSNLRQAQRNLNILWATEQKEAYDIALYQLVLRQGRALEIILEVLIEREEEQ